MKRTGDAELFDKKCPYTGNPCYEWECGTCEVEAEEMKSMKELDMAEKDIEIMDESREEIGVNTMEIMDCGEISCEDCGKDKCIYKTTNKIDVLDKIRAEVEQLPITDTAVKLVTEIINKYKSEMENME